MMKKVVSIAILGALFMFSSSSIWEGAASVTNGSELPSRGLYAATSSFPVNTVLEVMNLENGRSVQVVVWANLDSPGLLAVLSPEAASALGLGGNSPGRVRMYETLDPLALTRLNEATQGTSRLEGGGMIVNLDDYFVSEGDWLVAAPPETTPALEYFPEPAPTLVFSDPEPAPELEYFPEPFTTFYISDPEEISTLDLYPEPVSTLDFFEPEVVSTLDLFPEPVTTLDFSEPHPFGEDAELSFVPAEERIPQETYELDRDYFIEPIIPITETVLAEEPDEVLPPAALFVPPLAQDLAPAPEAPPIVAPPVYSPAPLAPPPAPSPLGAPLITRLESGMYYLQIGAYSEPDAVRSELAAIDEGLPKAIMNAGTDERLIYRVLIGPLNLGESGAMLHRFRTTHADAFVRQGI
ncbi:MAG: hypothetical protein FWH12_08960 [Treponema sp.]|nr:hypothetical protein [Treponema sp.]